MYERSRESTVCIWIHSEGNNNDDAAADATRRRRREERAKSERTPAMRAQLSGKRALHCYYSLRRVAAVCLCLFVCEAFVAFFSRICNVFEKSQLERVKEIAGTTRYLY